MIENGSNQPKSWQNSISIILPSSREEGIERKKIMHEIPQ
jgi:hypothetical protein